MGLSNEQLIHEAVECNHAGVGATTLERYRDHLVHFAQYLASVTRLRLLRSEQEAGPALHGATWRSRADRAPTAPGFAASGARRGTTPTADEGPGWSASYRKSYLSALRFLYRHFQADDELPDIDPTVLESSPE